MKPVLLFLLPALAWAGEPWQDHQALSQAAGAHLRDYYGQLHPALEQEIRVQLPDPRLRLNACDKELTVAADNLPGEGGRVTVELLCQGQANWRLHLAADVTLWADILVTRRALLRGHRIDSDDLGYQRLALSQVRKGSLRDETEAIGQEARRNLAANQPLRLQDIQAPMVVKRGDLVQITASLGGLKVVTPATALNNGRLGEQIRVENNRSSRTLKARVVGEGQVEVVL